MWFNVHDIDDADTQVALPSKIHNNLNKCFTKSYIVLNLQCML